MGKRKTSKSVANVDCPDCGHHKAWSLPLNSKRCTKCGFKFVFEQKQERVLPNLFGKLGL